MTEPTVVVAEDVDDDSLDPDMECLEEADVAFWRAERTHKVTVSCWLPLSHEGMHEGRSDDGAVQIEWPA